MQLTGTQKRLLTGTQKRLLASMVCIAAMPVIALGDPHRALWILGHRGGWALLVGGAAALVIGAKSSPRNATIAAALLLAIAWISPLTEPDGPLRRAPHDLAELARFAVLASGLVVSVLALRCGPPGMALAAGLSWLSTSGFVGSMLLFGLALGASARDEAAWRRTLSNAGIGLIALLTLQAFAFEWLAWPRYYTDDWFELAEHAARWHREMDWGRPVRRALEVSLLLALVPFARGRVIGIFTTLGAVGALTWALRTWYPLHVPSGGCVVWAHPMVDDRALAMATMLAVLPWIGPMARWLRAS